MSSNGFIISFNGEIYNHHSIRKNFLGDQVFHTNSDTETLLKLFINLGIDGLKLIDGMFAFVIYDLEKNKLIMGRDRAGKKPLYVFSKDRKLIFSSELNSLKKGVSDIDINHNIIVEYLKCGFISESNTPYQNTFEIMSGELKIFDISLNTFETRFFFKIEEFYKRKSRVSLVDAIDNVDKLLHKG